MAANPALGVVFHWLGGLASGSFYVPYRGVKKWAWEVYWLVGGFFSWIIAPWVGVLLLVPEVRSVLSETSWNTLFWTYFFGAMWGLGGLTFGLTMRYLGMSLGMAVALGYCAAFGTLMPPIFNGEFVSKILHTNSGVVILVGIGVCLLGIAIAGLAGITKEREMPEEQKKAAIKEFSFWKGLLVATFSGVMSASFSYGLAAGDPIKELMLKNNFLKAAQQDGIALVAPAPAGADNTQKLWTVLNESTNKDVKAIMASEDIRTAKEPKAELLVKHVEKGLGEKAKPEDKAAADALLATLKTTANPVAGDLVNYFDQAAKIKNAEAAESLKDLESFRLKQMAVQIENSGGKLNQYMGRFGLWQGLPVLVVVLLGGFTTNFIWCVLLNIKNRTGGEYFSGTKNNPPKRENETIIETAIDAPSEEMVEHMPTPKAAVERVPLLNNYFFSALAGVTWYLQFFFYTMGETQMGNYKFSSWTLHMASIIIFSTLWGIALKEWKGSSKKTHWLIALGLATLVGSTLIVGYGNYLKQ